MCFLQPLTVVERIRLRQDRATEPVLLRELPSAELFHADLKWQKHPGALTCCHCLWFVLFEKNTVIFC